MQEGEDADNKEAAVQKKRDDRHKPNELQLYTEDELASFKKRELMADAELLDGARIPVRSHVLWILIISLQRN